MEANSEASAGLSMVSGAIGRAEAGLILGRIWRERERASWGELEEVDYLDCWKAWKRVIQE